MSYKGGRKGVLSTVFVNKAMVNVKIIQSGDLFYRI